MISFTTECPESKAKLSWYLDVAWSIANLAFLYAWVTSIRMGGGIFQKEFLEAGFCNAPQEVFPTQMACCVFDIAMAVLVTIMFYKGLLPKNDVSKGLIIYLIVHGFLHGLIGQGLIDPRDKVDSLFKVTALASILMLGPTSLFRTMVAAADKPLVSNPKIAICMAALLEVILVFIFVYFLRDGVYVLSYINTSVLLCDMCPRVLLIGPDKVEARLKLFGPYYFATVFSTAFVIIVAWLEPTNCFTRNGDPGWFSLVGGHFWFDVALFLASLVGALNHPHGLQVVAKPKKD